MVNEGQRSLRIRLVAGEIQANGSLFGKDKGRRPVFLFLNR